LEGIPIDLNPKIKTKGGGGGLKGDREVEGRGSQREKKKK